MRDSLLIVVGSKSIAVEIRECADLILSEKYTQIVNMIGDDESCSFSSIFDSEAFNYIANFKRVDYIIGFVDVKLKKKIGDLLSRLNCNPINVIHPTAYISKSSCLGIGNYIGPNVVLSTEVKIGNYNLLNFNVTIGHNAIIGDCCTLNPGCRVSGHDIIEDNCLIGSNSFIFQGLKIAHDTQIDAMTYVKKNIEVPSFCKSQLEFKMVKNLYVK